MSGGAEACDECLRRTWLLSRLAGHLEPVRARIQDLLALSDEELVGAVGGACATEVLRQRGSLHLGRARRQAAERGLILVCRHADGYPSRLRDLAAPPAVLHVAGSRRLLDQLGDELVALVGSRRASGYGREVTAAIARELSRAGITVLSGMAAGIDASAHEGALAGPAGTVAILPSGAERPYPPSQRGLYQRITAAGAAISELPPGSGTWRWSFPARNRIVAALAAVTVVVEAGGGSGALVTAHLARDLGRTLGAVPGQVTFRGTEGPHALIRQGALLIRNAQDVLDALLGAGVRAVDHLPLDPPEPHLQAVLSHVESGRDTLAALEGAGIDPEHGLSALAALELGGWIRRGAGGRFIRTA